MYLTLKSNSMGELLRGYIPSILEEYESYAADQLVQTEENRNICIFADSCFYSGSSSEWKWQSGHYEDNEENRKSSITNNPLFSSLKISIQDYINMILTEANISKVSDQWTSPINGLEIGVENRLCKITPNQDNSPCLEWHCDTDGFLSGNCWTAVLHYLITPNIRGGSLDLKYDEIVNYVPEQDKIIIFGNGIEHQVNNIQTTNDVGYRGSLQLFFSERSD